MKDQRTKLLSERRTAVRHPVRLDVNFRHGDAYLYSRASNLSEFGIFLVSDDPLPQGATLELQFNMPGGGEPLIVTGEVVWVDEGAADREQGMGIRFIDLPQETKTRVKALIRTVAYLE